MADINIDFGQVQQFHNDFDQITRSMLDSLIQIRSSFDANCTAWQDEGRFRFEELLSEMTTNLSVFIDTECQGNLMRLQGLINSAQDVKDSEMRIHKGY